MVYFFPSLANLSQVLGRDSLDFRAFAGIFCVASPIFAGDAHFFCDQVGFLESATIAPPRQT